MILKLWNFTLKEEDQEEIEAKQLNMLQKLMQMLFMSSLNQQMVNYSLHWTIVLNFVSDAAAVIAQERHLIAGTALNVYYAPVPASRRYKGDKLIIQNIPKGTEQKKLIVFIEAKLDLEFEEEFKLEMHNQVAIMSLQSSYNDEGEYHNYLKYLPCCFRATGNGRNIGITTDCRPTFDC